MAEFFSSTDIEEFRECFYLNAQKGEQLITSEQQLTQTMRSLGFSPTIVEIKNYYKQNEKDGKIDFASFLDIMKSHSNREKCQQDIMSGLQAHDKQGQGTIPAAEFRHILTNFGDKLSSKEVDQLLQEAGQKNAPQVRYADVVKVMLTPIPDY